MPLAPQQFERLAQRFKAERLEFQGSWKVLVNRQLIDVDERLVADVGVMRAFTLLRPLPDADRVLCRQRVCWIIARHPQVRGTLGVPETWSAVETLRALRGEDGDADRCPRPDAELRLLLSLVDFYAEQVVLERIQPKVTQWIESVTAAMLHELALPEREWGTVQGFVLGLTQKTMVDHLVTLGQLRAAPAEIRGAPFRAYE